MSRLWQFCSISITILSSESLNLQSRKTEWNCSVKQLILQILLIHQVQIKQMRYRSRRNERKKRTEKNRYFCFENQFYWVKVSDWGQEEKWATEDEMIGWHHWLNGHEFEQTLGDSEGQGSLVCCSPWGRKESDMTEPMSPTLAVRFFTLSRQGCPYFLVVQSLSCV